MAKCAYCGVDFPLLPSRDDNTHLRCGKCTLRLPGLSLPEITAINNKPQCAGCGVSSRLIKDPLCKGCIEIYKKEAQIPRAILSIPGVAALLLEEDAAAADDAFVMSDEAAAVVASAQQFQANSSGLRLTKKTTSGHGSETTGLNRYKFKNLSKAQQVVAERKTKRDEVNLVGVGNGIKVSATLWSITEGQNKMVQIAGIRVAQVFGPETRTQNALDTLLESVQTAFSNRHPDAELLTWPHIHLYAHESQQKYVSLDYFIRELPMSQFFNEFVKGKLAADNMLKDKKIEIRFAYFTDDVFRGVLSLNESYCLPSSHSKALSSVAKSSQLIPRNKKLKTTDPDIMPAPLPSGSSRLLPTHLKSFEFAVPDIPPAVRPVPILRSAFRRPIPPPTWTRDIEMVTSSFIRTTASYMPANGLNVEFEVARDVEEIQIAAHWEKPDDEGYIGEGFTKRGIYARFMGQEYVITQPTNLHMTDESVQHVLQAEYSLLCIGDVLKGEFDRHAQECEVVTIPKFYFNFKNSIFGRLVPSLSSQSRPLPHLCFIATPLLPCGKLNGKLKKFTGNDEFGDADNHLTKAVHAFSHFTAVYTQETLVLCDLQGLYDRERVMCLVDPQAHTATRQDNTCHEYWDGGPKELKKFLQKHEPACKANWICQALNLSNVVVDNKLISPVKATVDVEGSQKRKRPNDLSFLLHSTAESN